MKKLKSFSDPINRTACVMELQALCQEGYIKARSLCAWESKGITQ